ncbi:MAG: hypothetical protein CR988_02795 [Treponema sp.]|nr:MAG: hypothetical protein CR988_02795 [Treponema sp.]
MLKLKNWVKGLCLFCVAVLFVACVSTEKHDPNFLGDFPVQDLGKIMGATVRRVKRTLKPAELSFTFNPRSNIVSVHHKFLGENVWINLSEENRTVFINAIHQYLSEYKEKKLGEGNNRKKGYFGKTPIYMKWGLFAAARAGKPTLRFEYELIKPKGRPYFIVGATTTKSFQGGANSPAIRIALSPAKCQDMLVLLKQKNLQKLVDDLQKEYEEFDMKEGFEEDEEFEVMKEIENSSTESDDSIDEDEADAEFNID